MGCLAAICIESRRAAAGVPLHGADQAEPGPADSIWTDTGIVPVRRANWFHAVGACQNQPLGRLHRSRAGSFASRSGRFAGRPGAAAGRIAGSDGTGCEAHPTPRTRNRGDGLGSPSDGAAAGRSVARPWSALDDLRTGPESIGPAAAKGDDRKQLSERLGEAAASLDLWEPFTRIREAIEEAQQAAR